ncbi:hypothetical protein N5J43_16785 [Pseudomonas nicosulfuronedens]|uniref:hypothetical protein n=1 Tax=Pseudomonas nicosulfuronedens TaxID=2571105 RepID=UPI002448968D|nr:hypothetical protein [Pseudomonas nicosulfuronedens]MDH1012024.1 hypothetical protein [Pseudomonas nicosulfuronedens]MDH1980608.1 hypothetical protein [Pseudomonas nicosulfuronedens]MDH2027558.1 hypothetical protein [Pseudomonas nicosulfuronedens]
MQIDLNQPGALTKQAVRDLIASVTDEDHVQLRVTKSGKAYISTTDVAAKNIDDLAFRLETWAAAGGWVGPDAAKDDEWVERIFNVIQENWPNPKFSYIDIY